MIEVDDEKINETNRHDYVDLFSYSSQNTFIFNSSMVDNISLVSLYENNIIDNERIKIVTNVTQLDKFINQLEYEGQTIIGEQGNRLSGGQKQRLGIARSLYANREIRF